MTPADLDLFPDGKFVMPSDDVLAALDEGDCERIGKLAEAWAEQVAAEDVLKEASDRLTMIVGQLTDVENYFREHHARLSQVELLRQAGMNKSVRA